MQLLHRAEDRAAQVQLMQQAGQRATAACMLVAGVQGFSHPCRCGDNYWLPQLDLLAVHGAEIVLPCRGCSNFILVSLDKRIHDPLDLG